MTTIGQEYEDKNRLELSRETFEILKEVHKYAVAENIEYFEFQGKQLSTKYCGYLINYWNNRLK